MKKAKEAVEKENAEIKQRLASIIGDVQALVSGSGKRESISSPNSHPSPATCKLTLCRYRACIHFSCTLLPISSQLGRTRRHLQCPKCIYTGQYRIPGQHRAPSIATLAA